MAFALTPLSRHGTSHYNADRPVITFDDEPEASSVSLPRVPSTPQFTDLNEMGREKERSHIEIHIDNDFLQLKGTGPDVEPTCLSGHVTLILAEPTSLKEVTLTFRGKARIPVPPTETALTTGGTVTYVVCSHDWSFLEGEKKHTRTLKAGRHYFPFQLQIGGSLPSSIVTPSLGGASIAYKLRALAIKPGLMGSKLEAVEPVYIMRTFAPEALEYQQTLEIENTWPGKLMYSILVPHKAWAAGDTLTAIVKFSPLVKGVAVLGVTTTVHETTKIYARSGGQEDSRVVTTAKHEISHGKAVDVTNYERAANAAASAQQQQQQQHATTPFHRRPSYRRSSRASSSNIHSSTALTPAGDSPDSSTSDLARTHADAELYHRLHEIEERQSQHPSSAGGASTSSASVAGPSSSSAALSSTQQQSQSSSSPQAGPSSVQSDHEATDDFYRDNNDVITQISIDIPRCLCPTHGLEPIVVSHRIRWSILLINMDGHTSELRCSLPLHILDNRLLAESRACTSAARRLLLGGAESTPEEEEDRELPSYSAHVRDRVANMFLPEAATMRVVNPWVITGTSPTQEGGEPHMDNIGSWPHSYSRPRSGHTTPLEAHLFSHLPHVPGSGDSTPLDWVNSELLLSLSQNPPPPLRMRNGESGTPPDPFVEPTNRSHSWRLSRPSSRPSSRPASRQASPERNSPAHPPAPLPTSATMPCPYEYVHNGHASRNRHSLFKATLKPFTTLGHSHHFFSRHPHASGSSTSQADEAPSATESTTPPHYHDPQQVPRSFSLPPELTDASGPELLHRAFTEVPDYSIASRGFIGGVPPLSSMTGLPSYEEASRDRNMRPSQSDGELAQRFARGMEMGSGRITDEPQEAGEQRQNLQPPTVQHTLSEGALPQIAMRRNFEAAHGQHDVLRPAEDHSEQQQHQQPNVPAHSPPEHHNHRVSFQI